MQRTNPTIVGLGALAAAGLLAAGPAMSAGDYLAMSMMPPQQRQRQRDVRERRHRADRGRQHETRGVGLSPFARVLRALGRGRSISCRRRGGDKGSSRKHPVGHRCLAAVVFAEKSLPGGPAIARVLGIGFTAAGIFVLMRSLA